MVKGIDCLQSPALYGGRDKGLACRFSTATFNGQIPLCSPSCENPTVHRQICYLRQWKKTIFLWTDLPWLQKLQIPVWVQFKMSWPACLKVYLVRGKALVGWEKQILESSGFLYFLLLILPLTLFSAGERLLWAVGKQLVGIQEEEWFSNPGWNSFPTLKLWWKFHCQNFDAVHGDDELCR